MVRALASLLLLVSLHAARADATDDAKKHYQAGSTHYDLGEYSKAIEEFKAGYELMPDAAFIYNIAQSYRQLGDAKNAIFFYKRYLVATPDAKNRKEVEQRIDELERGNPSPGGGKRVCADEVDDLNAMIAACKKAHKEKAKPRYLYNLGWAYEQQGKRAEAIDFYRQYLALKPDAGNRATVEQTIARLEAEK